MVSKNEGHSYLIRFISHLIVIEKFTKFKVKKNFGGQNNSLHHIPSPMFSPNQKASNGRGSLRCIWYRFDMLQKGYDIEVWWMYLKPELLKEGLQCLYLVQNYYHTNCSFRCISMDKYSGLVPHSKSSFSEKLPKIAHFLSCDIVKHCKNRYENRILRPTILFQ